MRHIYQSRAELAFLERRYTSEQAELVVLYGRRRVGKTELLRRFCEGKRNFFYVADLGTEASTLAELARRYGEMFHNDPESTNFATWDQAFKALAREAGEERLIVVLDEFTYLLQTSPTLPSILQRLWDETLQHTLLMLILSGSYIGIMEREVLAYQAPLYGRRTAQWHLSLGLCRRPPLSPWVQLAGSGTGLRCTGRRARRPAPVPRPPAVGG